LCRRGPAAPTLQLMQGNKKITRACCQGKTSCRSHQCDCYWESDSSRQIRLQKRRSYLLVFNCALSHIQLNFDLRTAIFDNIVAPWRAFFQRLPGVPGADDMGIRDDSFRLRKILRPVRDGGKAWPSGPQRSHCCVSYDHYGSAKRPRIHTLGRSAEIVRCDDVRTTAPPNERRQCCKSRST